jgi:hypothetical protein
MQKKEKDILKKLEKTLSVLLTLLILLPIAIVASPISSNSLVVKAASSAAITLSKSEGYVGDYVTVDGSGFTPNKDVEFMWGDNLFSSLGFIASPGYQRPSLSPTVGSGAQVHTDALGNFKVQLQVPELTSGTYTIKATDTQNSATTSFTINPLIKLVNEYAYKTHGNVQTASDNTSSAYYIDLFLTEGFVGDKLALLLSGFGNGETVEVNIGTTKFGDFDVGSGTNEGYLFTNNAGYLPQMPSGDHTVNATGSLSAITALTTFTVKPELFLAEQTTPPPYVMSFPWIYSSSSFGLSWYSSVGTAVDSTFMFEATGLTGSAIQSVNLTYTGGSVSCAPSGNLTISTVGSTQGITTSTAPFATASPFGVNSPTGKILAGLTSGTVLSVVITTSGTGGAVFTFPNQLFASTASTSSAPETAGSLMWVEGQGAITNNGLNLSDINGNNDEVVATGLKTEAFWVVTMYPSGTTVLKTDEDALVGDTLSSINQTSHPLSFVDTTGTGKWVVGEDVYQDMDNSGNVTVGDIRINTVNYGGKTYWPWSTVSSGDTDVGRKLVKFATAQRPAIDTAWFDDVYLDYDGNGIVSAGDIRISYVPGGPVTPIVSTVSADNNGFFAAKVDLRPFRTPSFPGGGKEYSVCLQRFPGSGDSGIQVANALTMQVQASLTISTPTSYQSTQYVTQGSLLTLNGNGFFGNEPITISVGGKYVTTPTPPSSYGVLSNTLITMPALAGGEQTITVQGMFTTENTASANVTVTPTLSITPATAYNLNPLTQITVTGEGFAAGTYNIVFDGAVIGETVVSGLTVNGTGNFAGQINTAFNAPTGVEGNHIVDVVNTLNTTKSAFYGASYFTTAGTLRDTSHPSSPTTTEFPTVTIEPSLQAAPTSTIVGTTITVTGKGLQPSMTYYIWYDPRDDSSSEAVLVATTPATVTTDTEGTLMASFQIPSSSGGARYLWVSTSNTYVDNDPVSGSPVYNHVYIEPAITLAQSSGAVGSSVAVSFTGLYYGDQYQLWWYKPGEAVLFDGGVNIPDTALLLGTATGTLHGNSTVTVSFTVPATAETGTVYAVDLSYYGDRYSVLDNPVFFTVGKIATTITLSLTPSVVTQGDKVAINGLINPAMSVNVILFITAPDGTSKNESVTSATSGTFTDTFTPNQSGTWQVTAQWAGNAVYSNYTSPAATITANPVDMTPTYELTALIIGIIALVVGLIVIVDLMRRRRVATPTAPPT